MSASTKSSAKIAASRHLSLGAAEILESDIDRVVGVLRSGRISPGKVTQEFEALVAKAHGMPYATYCNSGQSALHLALETLKLTQGPPFRRVLVPALTYISSLHAVWNAGLDVLLCDVDPRTYLMDFANYQGPRFDAIMPVHLFGAPCALPSLAVPIIEDGCESLGAKGTGYGHFLALSFYVAHTITTGVGGMAATRHAWLDDAIKRLCNHGRVRAADLYAGLRVDHFDTDVRFRFTNVGFSYKLGDVNAALGIGQLQRLPAILSRRRQVAAWLTERLQGLPLQLPTGEGHTYMMYPIVCHDDVRDQLTTYLAQEGIETRPMMPITNQPIVEAMLGDVEAQYPVAKLINTFGFYIGCHQGMTSDDCDRIAAAFRTFFTNT